MTVNYAVTIEWSGLIRDKEAVQRLSELHVLAASVVDERFEYDVGKAAAGIRGIHVAFVRVYRLEPAVTLPMEKAFGGCRSWIELPAIDAGALVSVLSDEEYGRRREIFASLLGVSF